MVYLREKSIIWSLNIRRDDFPILGEKENLNANAVETTTKIIKV